jgi:hypothetical protein
MSDILGELTPNILSTRAAIAADKSHHKSDDDPTLIAKRARLNGLQLERGVRKVLAGWPQPTEAQLQKVAAILTAGSSRGAGDET